MRTFDETACDEVYDEYGYESAAGRPAGEVSMVGMTQAAVAQALGLQLRTVQRIEARALRKFRRRAAAFAREAGTTAAAWLRGGD